MQSSVQILPQLAERYSDQQPLQRSEKLMFQTESSKLYDIGKHLLAKEVLKSSCLSQNTNKLHEFTAKNAEYSDSG